MAASATFRHPGGRRVTAVVEETTDLHVFELALPRAGFRLESIEATALTVWELAATAPDLLILDPGGRSATWSAPDLIAAARAHPRLRRIPILLYRPGRLRPVPMASPPAAPIRIVDPLPGVDRLGGEVRELLTGR